MNSEKFNQLKNFIISKKKMLIIIGFSLLVLVSVTSKLSSKTADEVTFKSDAIINNEINENVCVKIIGAVNKPGVYEVSNTSIVLDVIRLAGGITKNGTLKGVNTAKKVEEGMLINIIEEEKVDRISLNNATDEELELFFTNNLNSTKAKQFIKYRKENGSITTLDEVKTVLSLKESDYNKIKELITL